MRITGFHLDSFGIYHDQGIQDIPLGLALFLGENEAGKTTLMQFIRSVLFGFLKQRKGGKPVNEYLARLGGQHGGRLQMVMADGRGITLSRTGRDAILTEAGKAPETFKEPEKLLGGIDRRTFEHIFAVGLEDLKGLEVLTEEGMGGRLFSAGAGLGGASVPGALKYLDDELGKLVTPTGTGKTKLIGQLTAQLKQVEKELRDIRGQAGEYARGRRRLEELETQIRENRQEAGTISRRLERLKQLEQAREPWVKRDAAREKAGNLEYARDFPPDGLNRFHTLQEGQENLRNKQKRLEPEITGLAQQLSLLSVDRAVLEQQEAVECLVEDRKKLASALNDHPLMESKVNQAQEEFHRRLQDLGPHWTAPMLEQVDVSVAVRHQVSEFKRQLDAAHRQEEQALASQRTRQEAAAEARLAAEEAERHLQQLAAPSLRDEEEIRARRDAVRVIRSLLHQRDLIAGRHEAGGKALAENQERLDSLQPQVEAGIKPLPGWPGLAAAAAGALLAGALLYQRFYLPAGLSLTAAASLAVLLEIIRRRQQAAEVRRVSQILQEIAREEKSLQARRDEMSRLEEALEAVSQEMARVSQDTGLPRPEDLTQWEKVGQDLEQVAGQWRAWQTQSREREKAAAHDGRCLKKLEEAQGAAGEAFQQHQALAAEWGAWLADGNFSPSLRPEGFATVLQAVESARSSRRHLEESRLRLEQMTDYLRQTRARIRQALDACGKAPLTEEAGLEDLAALRRALAANQDIVKQQTDLEARLEAARGDLSLLKTQEQEMADQLRDLWQQAGAAEGDEFIRLSGAYREWRELIQKIDDEEIRLRTIAGTEAAQAALEEELAATEPLELQEEHTRLKAGSQEITVSVDADLNERGGLQRQLAEMARSDRLSELLLDERSLKEQLAEASRRWAALTVCRHLLDQARQVYERERQPQVITEAGRFLNTMTGDRYRLVAGVGEGSIHLEDTSLKTKEEIAWSAGLGDQVYLATRLGLAREFSRHTEPLPIILDDVLVKFDPTRRRAAARVILEVSREQQVLLFSCHPEFAEIFAGLRREPQFQKAGIACYNISDGVIGLHPDGQFL